MALSLKRLSLGVFIYLIVNSCASERSSKTIHLAHGLDTKHSVHIAMQKMSKDIDSLSNGKLKIIIYPSQQLGTERQCLELLQIGSIEMTKVSVGTLENFIPKMKILSLPFLFKDEEHSKKTLQGEIGKELLDNGEEFWLKGLGFYNAGSRNFYTKSYAINDPTDLKGRKIRTMESVTAIKMMKNLGASPTPISWGELYTALQQGIVDGAENNLSSFYLSGHYEICKNYSFDKHTMIPDVLIMNHNFWKKLNFSEKKWLRQAVKSSIKYQYELWDKSENEALENLKNAGVKFYYPNSDDFKILTKNIRAEYLKNPEYQYLINRIQDLEKRL